MSVALSLLETDRSSSTVWMHCSASKSRGGWRAMAVTSPGPAQLCRLHHCSVACDGHEEAAASISRRQRSFAKVQRFAEDGRQRPFDGLTWSWEGGLAGAFAVATLPARFRSVRTRLRGRGFGGEAPTAASKTQSSTKDFAMSESKVGRFNQQVLASIDGWCDELIAGLRDHGWWASSSPVLPEPLLRAMRQEVEDLWNNGDFIQSQSVLGGTIYYDKKHVFATEIKSEKYTVSPRMWHYTVTLTRELVRRVNAAFPDMGLSDKFIGNKLEPKQERHANICRFVNCLVWQGGARMEIESFTSVHCLGVESGNLSRLIR
eukprot:s5348_g1.t3